MNATAQELSRPHSKGHGTGRSNGHGKGHNEGQSEGHGAGRQRVVSEQELIAVVQRLAFRGETLTARGIAQAANVGTGTLYSVFPKVDELIGRARSDGAARILGQLDKDLFDTGYVEAVDVLRDLGDFAQFVADPAQPLVVGSNLEAVATESQRTVGQVMAGLTIAGLSANWPYEKPFKAAFAEAADPAFVGRANLDLSTARALVPSVQVLAEHIATTEPGARTETEVVLRARSAALVASNGPHLWSFRALTELTGIPASTAHRYDDAVGYLARAVKAASKAILHLTRPLDEPLRTSVRFELATELMLFDSLQRTLWTHRFSTRSRALLSALVLTSHQAGRPDLAWLSRAKRTLDV